MPMETAQRMRLQSFVEELLEDAIFPGEIVEAVEEFISAYAEEEKEDA